MNYRLQEGYNLLKEDLATLLSDCQLAFRSFNRSSVQLGDAYFENENHALGHLTLRLLAKYLQLHPEILAGFKEYATACLNEAKREATKEMVANIQGDNE